MAEREPYDPSRYALRQLTDRFFEVVHAHGSCSLDNDQESGALNIDYMHVDSKGDFRGRGIAQNMLRFTESVARELGATVITGSINDRASLQAMVNAYGAGSVTVRQLGVYGEVHTLPEELRTDAVLHHPIETL